jgi:YHS domain-containing protein
MIYLWIVLVVLSPAILYAIALLHTALYRGLCSHCHQRGLKMAGAYKWDGKKSGGGTSFYFCEKCHCRFKKNSNEWTEPTDSEWTQHVKKNA